MTAPALHLIYRGPLASCNYSCSYCPFALRRPEASELRQDRHALRRFIAWVERLQPLQRPLRLLMAPRGEALIHRHVQRAMTRLSYLPHLQRVAIQTNLSAELGWLDEAAPARVGLWATFHPGQAHEARFIRRCLELHRRGVSLSVGLVGLPQHLDAMERLRTALPEAIYLWVNACKDRRQLYDGATLARIVAVDPLFPLNLRPQPSEGRPCHTGSDLLAVLGDGTLQRCLFCHGELGRLDRPLPRLPAEPPPCPQAECRCHIGYVHLPHLGLRSLFGAGVMERALDARTRRRLSLASGAGDPPQAPGAQPSRRLLRSRS